LASVVFIKRESGNMGKDPPPSTPECAPAGGCPK
jgi:hypothetical protein